MPFFRSIARKIIGGARRVAAQCALQRHHGLLAIGGQEIGRAGDADGLVDLDAAESGGGRAIRSGEAHEPQVPRAPVCNLGGGGGVDVEG